MNIPFMGLYFASYETAKKGLMRQFGRADSEETLLIQACPPQSIFVFGLCYTPARCMFCSHTISHHDAVPQQASGLRKSSLPCPAMAAWGRTAMAGHACSREMRAARYRAAMHRVRGVLRS